MNLLGSNGAEARSDLLAGEAVFLASGLFDADRTSQ